MAETPFNGHAPDGQQTNSNGTPTPMMPRVAAPEGARSARAFDGSPIVLEDAEPSVPETTAFDEALADPTDADATDAQEAELELFPAGSQTELEAEDDSQADISADLQESFLKETHSSYGADAPPLGISIEKVSENSETDEDETNGFEAYAPADFREQDDDPDPYRNNDLAAAGIDSALAIEGEQLFADDGAGGEPPSDDDTALAAGGGSGRPDAPKDAEQGLFEHLAELRSRLLYATIGVMAVMCITWNYALPIQGWFSAPISRVLNQNGVFKGELISTDPTAFFTLQFQSSLLAALIVAAPWVLFQVWRFIEPALTNSERRYTLVLVPFSSILFFMGAALGYVCAPLFFQFFLQFQPPGVAAQWRYDESVILMAKMLLIFGLAFQVPIIIIFGNKIGLLSRNLLIEYWRHAVVAIFIVVAVLTPTWDPFTMTACALPPCLLYLLSIWLVKWL